MRFVLAVSLWVVLVPSARAADDHEYDSQLRAELHAADPVAESLFFEGTRLRVTDRKLEAVGYFRKVTERLPEFWPAYRRAALTELWLGNRTKAITELRWLAERDTTAYTLAALADALSGAGVNVVPEPAELQEAFRLLARARAQLPEDPTVLMTLFWTGFVSRDSVVMREAVVHLQRLDGSSANTSYASALLALVRGDAAGARTAIARARNTRLPPEVLASLEESLAEVEAVAGRRTLLFAFLWSVVVWLALLGLLALVGLALSRATLAAADRALAGASGAAVGLDAMLRRAYSSVIAASAVFYYVSLPMLFLVVAVTGGGLVWMLLNSVRIWKLIGLVALLTLVTLWAVLRSLFVRAEKGDPGRALDLSAHPRLRSVLEEVATRVGTRPVDVVFLTPGTEVAVFERGGWLQKLQGRGERCLLLGLGVLDGMKLGAWKAILAHEYGHFVNRDTAGGGMALAVRRSVMAMAVAMAQGGAAGWYNPAWWFVRGFHASFMRVSQGASRLQEVLADRWASLSYGASAFRDGLTHVIQASVRFGVVTDATIRRALSEKLPVANLYRHAAPLDIHGTAEVDRLIREALSREPDAYDSHPSPAQRFAWVERVEASGPPRFADPGDQDEAWSLLEGREELEEQMTSTVRANVEEEYDVKFADPPEASG